MFCKRNKRFGFNLAEILIVITILGIVAAVLVATLRPKKYVTQSYLALKQNIYRDIDSAVKSVLRECTDGRNLLRTHVDCSRSNEYLKYDDINTFAQVFAKYLRGTVGGCDDSIPSDWSGSPSSSIKLRNGACIYFFHVVRIKVDVNGPKGPNDLTDTFYIYIDTQNGTVSDMPKKAISGGYACNKTGCAECSNNTCTKCYCDYRLVNRSCISTRYDWITPGCASHLSYSIALYDDSNCTNVAVKKYTSFCSECRAALSVATQKDLYYKNGNTCTKHAKKLVTCNVSSNTCESY